MRRYETIFITHADLPEEEVVALIDRYSDVVKAQNGTLIKVEKWGKRKLAYEIKKQSRGYYVLFDFAGSSALVVELERNLKIGDKILKYMTVKINDAITLEEIEKELAALSAEKKEEATPAEEGKPAAAPEAAAEAAPAPQESEISSPTEDVKEEKE